MQTHEFLGQVRSRGGYADIGEAEKVTHAVLEQLGQRLPEGQSEDLAAQLPPELQRPLQAAEGGGEGFGVEQFLTRVADALNTSSDAAASDAGVVLSTLAASVAGGQLNQLLTQLQPGYAALFGKPELS